MGMKKKPHKVTSPTTAPTTAATTAMTGTANPANAALVDAAPTTPTVPAPIADLNLTDPAVDRTNVVGFAILRLAKALIAEVFEAIHRGTETMTDVAHVA
jgi:hypothetical protein